MNAHRHEWRKGWSDGVTGSLECATCQKRLLVPVGDLAWWGTREQVKESCT